eukprot:747613-Rhodomonas_salina.1
MEDFYAVLEGVLLETGIAKPNPRYDPSVVWSKDMPLEDVEKCCRIEIVKPERLASTDETEATTNQSGGSTMARDAKILCIQDGFDDGETLCNKTSQRASMYGGSFASGKSLRPFAIFNSGPLIQWIIGGPKSSIKNLHTGEGHRTACAWNESGGATGATFLEFLKAQFYVMHDADGKPLHDQGAFFQVSKEDPVVLIVDGHGSHFTEEVLEWCIEHGVHIVLRPPHTSHVSQGED